MTAEEEIMRDPDFAWLENMQDEPDDVWDVEGGWRLRWTDFLAAVLVVGIACLYAYRSHTRTREAAPTQASYELHEMYAKCIRLPLIKSGGLEMVWDAEHGVYINCAVVARSLEAKR